jgi:hypothetical protein
MDGNSNTGDWNTGDWNTGNRNTGNSNTGDLNTNNPTVRIFNKDSGWIFRSNNHCELQAIIHRNTKNLCQWIFDSAMTDKEKEDNPTYKTTGGYLKVTGYKQKGELSNEDREFLSAVPNFDANILFECTGIRIDNEKTITIDGKDIKLSSESNDELKKMLVGEE